MKKIRKLIPVSLYDMPGLEAWLEEQANQGLFPVHIGTWAVFREGGVPGTRFRLDAFGKTGTAPTEEQLELYGAYGWRYALPIGRAFFLFYNTDPEAVELHTDLQTQGMSLDRLAKQLRSYKILTLIGWGTVLLFCLLPFLLPLSRFDVQPDRFADLPRLLAALCIPYVMFGVPVVILWRLREFRQQRMLLDLHDRLKEGEPPAPSPGPSRSFARTELALLVLSILLILSMAAQFAIQRTVRLEDFSSPYVSLTELEQEPLLTWAEYDDEMSDYFKENHGNTARRRVSLLVPVWYEVNQDMVSPQPGEINGYSPDPEDGRYTYSPDLDAVYARTLPAFAPALARSILHEERLVNIYWVYEEPDVPGLDLTILSQGEDSPWQMAALVKGGRIAVYRYGGMEKLEDHMDLLVSMVTD